MERILSASAARAKRDELVELGYTIIPSLLQNPLLGELRADGGELPLELQKKFLFFATGSDRVPIKGLGNLNFVISRNGADQERLPSAHTCFQHLLLPEYTTKERLRKQLLKAMQETQGFQLV